MQDKNRPDNTAFKQQRLRYGQPIMTPTSVIPALFIFGIAFGAIGFFLRIANEQVSDIMFDYTRCNRATASFQNPKLPQIEEWKFENGQCTINFKVNARIKGPVYLFYRLTSFYQNHRKYAKSLDVNQLLGAAVALDKMPEAVTKTLAEVIVPEKVLVDGVQAETAPKAVYYPAGLIANSMFTGSYSF